MNVVLVKLFATALTLSQVTTRPDAIRTDFDPVKDKPAVAQLLRDGCAHMKKAFDIEDINLDDLISTAMDDPQALTSSAKVLQGIEFKDLHAAYREFCKNEKVEGSPVDLGEVIAYYDKAVADLPDHAKLKGLRLPGATVVLDGKGERFAEIYEPDHRRRWVPLADIPPLVQKAFVAAEDKRFFQHKGVDERGVIRAFVGNFASPGRPQGGSTISQQVAKNLLVGDDVTYDRKMREMIVAARMERMLSKSEILELYLNSIYLGRASWGIEMAAQSYFGKPAKNLTLREGALLAGLPKGPNYYNPDRWPERAQERVAYVLTRMKEDGVIAEGDVKQALAAAPRLAAFERPRRDSGFYALDHLTREAKTFAGVDGLTASSYTVRATIEPALQRAAETSLQEGLARYELNTGRYRFEGAEANLADVIRKIETAPKAEAPAPAKPAWQQALERTRLPLYDVHWPAAVVVSKAGGKGGESLRVGLTDGRIVPLTTWSAAIRRELKVHDVVRVRVVEPRGKGTVKAEMRVKPTVQGAAVVLDNKSGRILAMAGGFSYPLSQLNRVTQARRQPGSTFKPLSYLAALNRGLQPNTLVWDAPVTLPPVGGGGGDEWSPKNYDGGASGLVTLRRALENSKNLVTARLLDGGISAQPEDSLKRVCELAVEAQLYLECERYYPFVLGAQPVRMIDLAAFYAAIANEGARPTPYVLESLEQDGKVLYRHEAKPPVSLGSADRVAFYQLKTMLQGVVERGTAASIRKLAPYVAGKTGTTENENDAWFVGFTNDVTVAVWMGYDNADGKQRRTLGRGMTGAKAAIPIFEPIVEAVWAGYAPKTALAPPSADAARQIASAPIDLRSGDRVAAGTRTAFLEHFRVDRLGRTADTQYQLVPREQAYAYRMPETLPDGDGFGAPGGDDPASNPSDLYERRFGAPRAPERATPRYGQGPYAQAPYNQPPSFDDEPRAAPRRGLFNQWPFTDDDDRYTRRPRRVDPDYFWRNGQVY
jgi:membrane carboxypeptidase/penicillin-binding protein